MSKATTFGLSLGNENMVMAVWQDDCAQVVVNADGHRTTPAYVAYSEAETVVGDTAKLMSVKRPREVVHSLLSVVKNAEDPDLLRSKKLGFQLEVNDANVVTGVITQPGMDCEAPTTTSSLSDAFIPLFKYAKGEVEAFTGTTTTGVVVTLPHYTCDSPAAVAMIVAAAKSAGLEVLRVIRPATAAIIHATSGGSAKGPKSHDHEATLVLDIGGAASTASLVYENNGTMQVATEEMATQSGRCFTKVVYDHLATEFKRKTRIDIIDDARAKRKLMYESERCKKSMTNQQEASVQVEALSEGADFNGKMTTSKFEMSGIMLTMGIKSAVKKVLDAEHLTTPTRILLIGGGANNKQLTTMAEGCGAGSLVKFQMPEEVGALGAAEQTHICDLTDIALPVAEFWAKAGNGTAGKAVDASGVKCEVNLLVKDVSLRTAKGDLMVLATESTPLPFVETFELPAAKGKAVLLDLVEGKKGETTDLAKLPFTPTTDNKVSVTVTIDVDTNITISATDGTETVSTSSK